MGYAFTPGSFFSFPWAKCVRVLCNGKDPFFVLPL